MMVKRALPLSVIIALFASPMPTVGQAVPAAKDAAQNAAKDAANASDETPELVLERWPQVDLEPLEPAVGDLLSLRQQQVIAAIENAELEALETAFGEMAYIAHAHELWPLARAAYINASRLQPQEPRWVHGLGIVYQQQGELDAARRHLETAVEMVPNNMAALVYLAEIAIQQNRPADAEPLMQRVLEMSPESPNALAVLGEAALAQRDWQRAIDVLERALGQAGEANRLHYPLALAYRGAGDVDKARQHLELKGDVGIRPPDPVLDEVDNRRTGERAYLLIGHQAFAAGELQAAAEAFAKALEASPESLPAKVDLAAVVGLLGDTERAEALLVEVLKTDPSYGSALYNLGILRARRGDHDDAILYLESALRANAEDRQALLQLGESLRAVGATERAARRLIQAVELRPDDSGTRISAAQLLIDLGRFREARQLLEEGHRLTPADGLLAHALARLLAAAPELEVRNGELAVRLATMVAEATGRATHLETLALALAENGDCARAAEVQTRLMHAAADTAPPAAQAALERYQAGAPCRPLFHD